MVCSGPSGIGFEVDPSGNKVWEYQAPYQVADLLSQGTEPQVTRNVLFRTLRYTRDSPELKSRTNAELTPGEPVERDDHALLIEGARVAHRAAPGATVTFSLRAGDFAGMTYIAGTSMTPGLIPLDGRFLRLGVDPILDASVSSTLPSVFKRYIGALDTFGRATATMTLPNDPLLLGSKFYTAFVVADVSAPSSLGFLSNTVTFSVE